MAKYNSILETVGRTPCVKINKLGPKGVNLYVKIEAFNPLGSVKDRLALGVIEAAEKSGELKPGMTVVEATSGNTGIGLAMVCAAKGYPLVVTMAETFSVERRKLMRFLGAKVVLTPAAGRGLGMVEKAQELAKAHGWFLTRQFENEANPDMHERTTGPEIVADFKDSGLDYWVTGFGTGGTFNGVSRVLRREMPNTKSVLCEPADAPMAPESGSRRRNESVSILAIVAGMTIVAAMSVTPSTCIVARIVAASTSINRASTRAVGTPDAAATSGSNVVKSSGR